MKRSVLVRRKDISRFLSISIGMFLFAQNPVISKAQETEAEVYRRSVSFDWDIVEKSKGYDLEVSKTDQGVAVKTFSFQMTTPTWTGKLVPGDYFFRVRSRDHRNVPGDWSEQRPFTVNLEKVKLKSPAAKSVIKAGEGEMAKVRFEWHPVGGASEYRFELTSEDGQISIQKSLKDSFIELDLHPNSNLIWNVSARSDSGALTNEATSSFFKILGTELAKPEIVKPEGLYVRDLNWFKPSENSQYEVLLKQYVRSTKKWTVFKKISGWTSNQLKFENDWPGGYWKISVKASAPDRQPSPVASLRFKVAKGDRSPATEYTATIKKSVDRINGWYGVANYLLTMMSYKSLTSFDSAIGGSGRLGLGWMGEKSNWGFLTSLELSGFIAAGKNYTFASFETSGMYRQQVLNGNELRYIGGFYLKELPVLLTPQEVPSQILNPNYESTTYKIGAMGPMGGLEYWHSLTPKLGIQLHSYFYYSLMKVSLPEGGLENVPQLSSQLGLLGSYRFNSKFTGLTGLTFRSDQLSYTDDYGARTGSTSIPGQVDVTIKGLYLHFLAEISF